MFKNVCALLSYSHPWYPVYHTQEKSRTVYQESNVILVRKTQRCEVGMLTQKARKSGEGNLLTWWRANDPKLEGIFLIILALSRLRYPPRNLPNFKTRKIRLLCWQPECTASTFLDLTSSSNQADSFHTTWALWKVWVLGKQYHNLPPTVPSTNMASLAYTI